MEIYLDNAATTRVFPEAVQCMIQLMQKEYGNPSSMHHKGMVAEMALREAAQTFARILKVDEKELIFTSGGSESNNMALIGAAMANKRAGRHIITTRIEHASVYQPMSYLEEQGFEVTYLPVDSYGRVRPEALQSAIRPDTILISIMCVNNEIGTVQPLEDIVRLIRERNPSVIIHSDAIQAFGKVPLYPKRLGLDMLSASGHKFHGPKGTGLLWIRDGVKVHPLILGGGQQNGRRSGTENVPGYAGMAEAARLTFETLEEDADRMYELRDSFIRRLSQIDGVKIHGGTGKGKLTYSAEGGEDCCAAPHIISAGFADVRAEVLLHALEEKGIYVSSGSACSSNHPQVSGTLRAIGAEKKYLDATVRFSLSSETTKEELDTCADALEELLPMLRRFVPGGRGRRKK